MKINKYGLQWDIGYLSKSKSLLLRNGGLCFRCGLNVDAFKGHYLVVTDVQTKLDDTYHIMDYYRFYAEELEQIEDISNNLMLAEEWYHLLQNGYTLPKSAFRLREGVYRMPITSTLKKDKTVTSLDTQIVSDMLSHTYFPPDFQVVENAVGNFFIIVSKQLYEQLPAKWTVHDIENLLHNKINSVYRIYEQPWQEIAECRAQNKPIKIGVFKSFKKPRVFAEEMTQYGIRVASVLPVSTSYIATDTEEYNK